MSRRTEVSDLPEEFPEPSAESLARSAAGRARFQGLLAGAPDLAKLRERAAVLVAPGTSGRIASLQDLLVALFAGREEEQERVAGMIRLDPGTLDGLRTGELSVGDVAPEAVARLGRVVGLDAGSFESLVRADLERLPGVDGDSAESLRELQQAWDSQSG